MALLDGILKVQLQYCELQLAHVHLAKLELSSVASLVGRFGLGCMEPHYIDDEA